MKSITLIVLLMFAACHDPDQCSKSGDCCDNCKVDTGMVACKLSDSALQERKKTVIAGLQKEVIEKTGLPDGYAYRFKFTEAMLQRLKSFIKTENECCDFLKVNIKISEHSEFIILEITGTQQAKLFIDKELEL